MPESPQVVCFTDFWYPKTGGMERSIDNLCRSLSHRWEPCVVTRQVETDDNAGIPYAVRRFPADKQEGFYPAALQWIKREARPRVIHFFGFSFYWPEAQSRLIERCAALAETALVLKVPTSGDAIKYLRSTHSSAISIVDRFVALTDAIQRELSSCGVSPHRIVRLPNGVITSRFVPSNLNQREAARRLLGLPGGRLLLGFCGRFENRKRIDLLASAVNTMPAERRPVLVLVGDSDSTFGSGFDVSSRLSDDIRWIGEHRDMRPIYQALDVYVTASVAEGMSNSVLEAMASGLPVVASNIPGHCELVHDDVNGYLFESDNLPSLVGALETVSARSRNGGLQVLGEASRNIVVTRFDQTDIGERYGRLYDELLNSK